MTVIGAVSPPGGDLSEPVTQNTLRVVKVFWGLDANLAYKRHFPAINWLSSYSLYADDIEEYTRENFGEDWPELRKEALELLQQEDKLQEIVRLVGIESLLLKEQLVLDTAKSLREDFLHQNAFDDVDTYTSPRKMYWLLKLILTFHRECLTALDNGKELKSLTSLPVREKIAKAKSIGEDDLGRFEDILTEIKNEIHNL